ncbi:tyrosine-protein phosphatase [Chlorogloeopsis sp. ULAP01]|uniref:tyrosine-protein phosphatase n=1 Tax=Chlorogloeopsis sp. ULAP01 TaxID=3056483 RepID=UPI0025AB1678|nr:tyrosine-protein phosphatase [Chlorogloeopsis sp. ULAP01]MDM9379996.1 tyrosine-protein phosphatase [Chlorogloeopsis sp. ULAP01]
MSLHQPLERLLALEGCYNTRDIGGYETLDGKKTRWRTVLRSDSLHRLTPASQQLLLNYGVRTIIDLRYLSEVSQAPNVFSTSPHVTYFNLPLFSEELEAEMRKAGTLFKQCLLLLDSCQQQIKTVMSAIATNETSVLVHCVGGKDRTGIITALLLAIANVPVATIAQDYAMSADYLAAFYAPMLETATKQGYAHMFESPPQTVLETFNYLEQQYGGVVGYLKTIGMTGEQINHLHEMLVD